MIAEVVAIGDELVHGGLLDTNSKQIARELERVGCVVRRFTVVGDDPEVLRQALADACARADVVVATGGLGPTLDDRTRDVAAELVGEPLRFDEPSWQQILTRFERLGRSAPDSNRRQAELPHSATALENPVGTAPGFRLRVHDRSELFVLPGVPREMHVLLETHVLPAVRTLAGDALTPTAQWWLYVLGPSEAQLGERIADFMRPGRNPAVGVTASAGLMTVRVVATAATVEQARDACEQTAGELRPLLGEWCMAEGVDRTVAELVVEHLRDEGRTVAFAESCTGGLCAARLTDVAGSSDVLRGGVVAYANEAKRDLLDVPDELLQRHGAVSEPVAAAMAAGALLRLSADVALSTTGIAGPGGGSPEKPVGTVCFAIARRGDDGAVLAKAWTRRLADLGRGFVRDRVVLEVFRELLS